MGICQSLLGGTTQESVESKSKSNDNKPVILHVELNDYEESLKREEKANKRAKGNVLVLKTKPTPESTEEYPHFGLHILHHKLLFIAGCLVIGRLLME